MEESYSLAIDANRISIAMKPLQCIFGHHKYKPKDVIVYFKGNRGGRWYYRAVHKCCLCGAEK